MRTNIGILTKWFSDNAAIGSNSFHHPTAGRSRVSSTVVAGRQYHNGGFPQRRVWVRYKTAEHDAGLRAIEKHDTSHRTKIDYHFRELSSVVVTATDAEIRAIEDDPEVVSVVEDPKRFLHSADGNLRQNYQASPFPPWNGQMQTYGIGLTQADQVWQEGLTGSGVTVCVLDSGFDITHEDCEPDNFSGHTLDIFYDWTIDSLGHGECPQSSIL